MSGDFQLVLKEVNMRSPKLNKLLLLVLYSFSILLGACQTNTQQNTQYDPSKSYASFLVLNSPNSAKVLDNIKQISIADGYEIGPIEYYNPGTKDFEPVLRKLTSNKQVTLLWIASGLLDTRDVQKSLAVIGFKGSVRYMPVTGNATPIQ
jgi:hypothetical protein